MTQIPNMQSVNQAAVGMLTQILFCVHFWQNLSILGNDGAMFNLDTNKIDVDFDGKGGGVGFLKSRRLIPLTTTQGAKIDNKTGFAVSNVFQGNLGTNGEQKGMSGMQSQNKVNVEPKWSYPHDKLNDMMYTFGKYGLVAVTSFPVYDEKSERRAQEVFAVIMSGCPDSVLLEDIPEYFGEFSPYLPGKKPARFRANAEQQVEKAVNEGVEVQVVEIKQNKEAQLVTRMVKLNAVEYTAALEIIPQLAVAAQLAHTMALDLDAGGILANTRDQIAKGRKKGFDRSDQWLMGQFPSFPMDTMLEKSQKQLIRALEVDDRNGDDAAAAPEGFVPVEVFEAEKIRNDKLEQRMNEIEQKMAA